MVNERACLLKWSTSLDAQAALEALLKYSWSFCKMTNAKSSVMSRDRFEKETYYAYLNGKELLGVCSSFYLE